jgi:hypothetical protein
MTEAAAAETAWIVGLGDRQFPVADLEYITVSAPDCEAAKAKAREGRSWAWVASCVPSAAD